MNYLDKATSFQAKDIRELILRICFTSARSSLTLNRAPVSQTRKTVKTKVNSNKNVTKRKGGSK